MLDFRLSLVGTEICIRVITYAPLSFCVLNTAHYTQTYLEQFLVFFFKQKTAYEIMPSLVGSEMCIRDRKKS